MVFGTTTFKCNECGTRFVSTAMEWNATVFLAPMPCPKCGSVHTYPAGIGNFYGIFGAGMYKLIWKQLDNRRSE